jgi:hypothetical protein
MSTQYNTKTEHVITSHVKCDACGKERGRADFYSFAEFCSYFHISTQTVITSMHSCGPRCYRKVQEMAKLSTARSIQTQLLSAMG